MTYEVGTRYPKPGDKVRIVQKKDYASGELTEGIVKDVLTKDRFHHRGHKVRLTNGIIGRVQAFSDQVDLPSSPPTEPPIPYERGEDDLV